MNIDEIWKPAPDFENLYEISNIQERDEIKNKYCENNNIFLIRIPYTDFKNISKEYIKHLLNNFQLK